MQLNIGQRILAGFALIIALMVALGFNQLRHLEEIRALAEKSIQADQEALRLIRIAGNQQRQMRVLQERSWTAYFFSKSGIPEKAPQVVQKEWQLAHDRTLNTLNELLNFTDAQAGLADDEDRRSLWQSLATNTKDNLQILSEISGTVEELFQLQNSDNLSQYRDLSTVLRNLRASYSQSLTKGEDLTQSMSDVANREINNSYDQAWTISVIALIAATAVGLVLGIYIHRSIAGPLGTFVAFVEKVGQGDLTQKIEQLRSDELGHLARYLNEMVDNLAEISRQAVEATENLNATTSELQASSQQQVASTNEQSAAIQQITATLDEITQSGGQISERAKAVATAAESASTASKSGLNAVSDTTKVMEAIREQAETVAENIVELTEKTQSVGEIIATVNDIAERSNLLALNAAIEASAAGEHGQSFTIVADEIKNLATQAKDATGQVKNLLGDIQQGISAAVMQTEEAVKRAETGKEQTAETEKTIRNLAESVEQSVATFEQIVAATNQQQVGIEQVTRSVQNIREAGEQVAAGTKELERTSASLGALSSQLKQTVTRYQV